MIEGTLSPLAGQNFLLYHQRLRRQVITSITYAIYKAWMTGQRTDSGSGISTTFYRVSLSIRNPMASLLRKNDDSILKVSLGMLKRT